MSESINKGELDERQLKAIVDKGDQIADLAEILMLQGITLAELLDGHLATKESRQPSPTAQEIEAQTAIGRLHAMFTGFEVPDN